MGRDMLSDVKNPKKVDGAIMSSLSVSDEIVYPAPVTLKSEAKKRKKDDADFNSNLELSKAFGSKRNRNRILRVEKTRAAKANNSNIKKNIVKATKEVKKSAAKQRTTTVLRVPPCNRDAKSVGDVYDVRELMSPKLLKALKSIATKVIKYNEEELSDDARFSDFFAQVLPEIDQKNVLKVEMLMFVDSLLKFLDIRIRFPISNNATLCDYSSELNKTLIGDFCLTKMNERLTRPACMRDKALCYILVLLLLIYDFKVNISVLSAHMRNVDYARLPRLMTAVGARPIDKTKDKVNFCLKLPLMKLPVGSWSSIVVVKN